MSNKRVRELELELAKYAIGDQDALRRAVITLGCGKVQEYLELCADESRDENQQRILALELAEAGAIDKAASRTKSAALARARKLANGLEAAMHLAALLRFALRGSPLSADECGSGLEPGQLAWLAAIVRGDA